MRLVVIQILAVFTAITVAVPSNTAFAQQPATYRIIQPDSVSAGEEFTISVVFDIERPWYLYAQSDAVQSMGMTAMSVRFESNDEVQVAAPIYPAQIQRGDIGIFWGQDVTIVQPIRVRPLSEPGAYRIRGTIRYQACKADMCLPPVRDDVRLTIQVK